MVEPIVLLRWGHNSIQVLREIAKTKLQPVLPAVLCSEIKDNLFNISGRLINFGEKSLVYLLSNRFFPKFR